MAKRAKPKPPPKTPELMIMVGVAAPKKGSKEPKKGKKK